MTKETSHNTDIAIIGMAGRFPMAGNIEEYWNNIRNGRECITHYTHEELSNSGIDPELLKLPNYIKSKGELKDIEFFDASFFNINPKDAELMDPQHRVMLETAWKAFEHAGYNPEEYDGAVGVYVGKSMSSYLYLNVYPHVKKVLAGGNLLAAIGNDKDSMATTISYHMDLKGPSIAIQSSSSTSLVSVCIACQSLLTYQCDMALAGGITAGPPLKGGYLYDVGGIMAKDGHNRSFDKDSTGFVPGNGCGAVVLKRLDDAIHDHDFIWAIIKGYNINNDGYHKVSYTAPSSEAQAELIAGTHSMSDIHPEQISYIETHGTGTKLGDPIEIKGATKAFRYLTHKKNFCAIGSVKSNIGHLDSAAGVAGLIKTVLALHHKEIPPSINFKTPNPEMNIEDSPFYVNTALKPWDGVNGQRYAGVTSLGMGGTNAHVILRDSDIEYHTSAPQQQPVITLSAKTPEALKATISDLCSVLSKEEFSLSDIAYTLSVGRKHFQYRCAVVAENSNQAINQLKTILEEERYAAASTTQRPVAFVFSPPGNEYAMIGKELYKNNALFRSFFDQCAETIQKLNGTDIRHVYKEPASTVDRNTFLDTPANTLTFAFSFQYALASYLMATGVTPEVLIGHGIGEFVAAAVGGVFSLQDIFKLVITGSKYFKICDDQVLLAVNAPEPEIIKIAPSPVQVLAVNSPFVTVISVEKLKVQELTTALNHSNIKYQVLENVNTVPFSAHEKLTTDLKSILSSLKLKKSEYPIISTITGKKMTEAEMLSTQYWADCIVKKVAFADCISTAIDQANYQFLVIGAGDLLIKFIGQVNHKNKSAIATACTVRNQDEQVSDSTYLANTLKTLWLNGVQLKWDQYYTHEKRRRVPLPAYHFEKTRHWIPSEFETVENTHVKNTDTHQVSLAAAKKGNNRPQLANEYVSPQSYIEKALCEIWENLLSIHPIGIHDNFFDLDGHSLLATQMVSRISDQLKVQLSIEAIFDYQTIAEMANFIESQKNQEKNGSINDLILEISNLSQQEISNELNKE